LSAGISLFLFGIIFGVVVYDEIDRQVVDVGFCSASSSKFDDWVTDDAPDEVPLYYYYYAYDATDGINAYLQQLSDPSFGRDERVNLRLDEVGPYVIRLFTTRVDVQFSEGGQKVAWKNFYRVEFQDELSCAGCSKEESVTNLNPAYLTALTTTEDEFVLGLTLSNLDPVYLVNLATNDPLPQCTPDSIAYSIGQGAIGGCDPLTDTQCCCNAASFVTTIAGGGGLLDTDLYYAGGPKTLNDILQGAAQPNYDCYARASNYLSLLAEWDGGVALENGDLLIVGGLPPTGYTSELFVSKSLRDFAYGYPTAAAGVLTGFGTWSAVYPQFAPGFPDTLPEFFGTMGFALAQESQTTDNLFKVANEPKCLFVPF
jgi:hypothetical protein